MDATWFDKADRVLCYFTRQLCAQAVRQVNVKLGGTLTEELEAFSPELREHVLAQHLLLGVLQSVFLYTTTRWPSLNLSIIQ